MDLASILISGAEKTVEKIIPDSQKFKDDCNFYLSLGMYPFEPIHQKKQELEKKLLDSINHVHIEFGIGVGLGAGVQGNKIGFSSDVTYSYDKGNWKKGNSTTLGIAILEETVLGYSFFHEYHGDNDVEKSIQHTQPFPSLLEIYSCPYTSYSSGVSTGSIEHQAPIPVFSIDFHLVFGFHFLIGYEL